MTEKAPAAKPTTVHWWKLFVAIGLTALGYTLALRPVLSSVNSEAAQAQRAAKLYAKVRALAARNAAQSRLLHQQALKLTATLREENGLRSEIAKVESQAPPPAASVAVSGVSVPAVHATSGASGLP
ncbi:MAG: hypothetical protein M0Z66_07820 [Thermaerobacter sp.]|nr:hypothetical protein [Thermaerobacter sp.]